MRHQPNQEGSGLDELLLFHQTAPALHFHKHLKLQVRCAWQKVKNKSCCFEAVETIRGQCNADVLLITANLWNAYSTWCFHKVERKQPCTICSA